MEKVQTNVEEGRKGFVRKEDVRRKVIDDGVQIKKSTSNSDKKTDGKKSDSDVLHSVCIKDDDGKDKFGIGRPGVERYCTDWHVTLKALENGGTNFDESSHGPLTLR